MVTTSDKKYTLTVLVYHCRNLNSGIYTTSFLLRSLYVYYCSLLIPYHPPFHFFNSHPGSAFGQPWPRVAWIKLNCGHHKMGYLFHRVSWRLRLVCQEAFGFFELYWNLMWVYCQPHQHFSFHAELKHRTIGKHLYLPGQFRHLTNTNQMLAWFFSMMFWENLHLNLNQK